ncbi:mucin-2 isoform X2 [Anastrepha ludens]|uniref:mucin-2 isoform X2 n=1 Tax=Anastrepha ludens TaxID=28586 RepID=UPI0023B0C5B3|nr:mucin-2 isoform X2 [Anastrepha ludens]
MDFISNLIKRPISLVRRDSMSPAPTDQGQTTTSSRPTTPQHSYSALLPFDRSITPEVRQQHIANALNDCLGAPNILETLNIDEEFRPIAATVMATRAGSPPLNRQSPTQAMSRSLQTSTNSGNGSGSGSNPSTTTGNIIEELLIQINDNLNKGDLHTSAELSQNHSPNRPLSVSPPPLTRALSSEFNAICSKSANLKGTQSSPSKESLPSQSPPLKSAAMAPVADNACSSTIIASEKNRSDIEPIVDLYSTSILVSFQADKSGEVQDDFNGTKVSEMPTVVNINTEDRAKLTFEDGLIPTLTAAINEHEKSACARGKDDSNNKAIQHLEVNIEPDTATSSDNETFAECQSYQISGVNNEYECMADEYSFENSEIESYFSAANSRNATITNVLADPLSLTIHKPEQSESDQGDLHSLISATSGEVLSTEQNTNLIDDTCDEEPMDVDMSFSELKENINVERSQLPTSSVYDENISPLKTEETECKLADTIEISRNSADNSEGVLKDAKGPQPEIETTQSEHEVPLNANAELPTSTWQNTNCGQNNLDSSSTEKASEVTADFTQATITTISPKSLNSINVSQNPTEECEIKKSLMKESNKGLSSSHNALNLSLDMNSSTNSSKSSASSPVFPFKHKESSLKQFPRSPTAVSPKSMTFLEKSEYTERIEIERKKSTASEPKLTLFGSRKTSVVDEKPARAATTEKETSKASSTRHNNDTLSTDIELNTEPHCTSNSSATSATIAPLEDASLTDNFDKPRTFTVASATVTEEEKIISQKCENENNKRRTFTIPNTEVNANKIEEKSQAEDRRRNNISAPIPLSKSSIHEEVNVPMDIDDILPTVSTNDENQTNTISAYTPVQSPTTTDPSSPPIPTLQNRNGNALPLNTSPPIPTLQNRSLVEEAFCVPTSATHTHELELDDEAFKVPLPPSPASSTSSPPMRVVQKRPSIHAYKNGENVVETLSAKEQTKRDASDEKDVFAGNCTPSPMDELPSSTSTFGTYANDLNMEADQQEFEIILNPSDFDYLLTKGNNSAPIDRSSILLRFDPLLGMPVPVSQIQQQPIKPSPQILQQILGNNLAANLSPTLEEDEHSSSASTLLSGNNQSLVVEADNKEKALGLNTTDEEESAKLKQYTAKVSSEKSQVKEQQQTTNFNKHANMSVDVIKDMNIDNDCKKSFENSNSQPDEKQINYKMDELEKKIKNEVLKTEDIEKKLKDAEQREEALIKRITEKDKTITKMTGVIEAYEKAIAELIAGKEELIQSYEKQLAEAKADRDSNYQHLTSLETTFADLHVKYGKSKEMTLQLKSNEEVLVAEKRQILENLRLQEQRYEKMKNHAMQQLEIANKKLESLNKEHSIESTKLKALLKKEEISRASINEQLQQKSRENAELVKICDELINGQGS